MRFSLDSWALLRLLEGAGQHQSRLPMAYADAFAAATAVDHGAVLLTGDPELLIPDAPWKWEDLRQ